MKKKCKFIASFGIILFCVGKNYDQNVTPKYLLMQKRDTYEYMDIIRGNWYTEKRLKELIDGISKDEKKRLSTYSFKDLWDDLWITHGNGIHKDGFEKAKYKFHSLSKDQINLLISSSSDEDSEPPWGFPKGRKNNGECEKDCALREFEEETKIRAKNIRVCHNVNPIAEFYKGKDGKNYCTYYFLAEAINIEPIKNMNTGGIRKSTISEEAGDMKWMTYEEAAQVLSTKRRNILKNIDFTIKTKYKEFSPIYVKETSSTE